MKTFVIGKSRIGCQDDFYTQFYDAVGQDVEFGHNLDALWDVLTGYIETPATIRWMNFSPALRTIDGLDAILSTLVEAKPEGVHLETVETDDGAIS